MLKSDVLVSLSYCLELLWDENVLNVRALFFYSVSGVYNNCNDACCIVYYAICIVIFIASFNKSIHAFDHNVPAYNE